MSCSTPGRPLADPTPNAENSVEEDFDPRPFDEDWPVPASIIEHDIPEDLLKEENSTSGSQKARSRNGYRVQLYVGLSQSQAKKVFNEAYNWWTTVGHDISLTTDSTDLAAHKDQIQAPIYLDYEQPNYKVRMGNFVSREEAKEFTPHLEGSFKGYFIAPSRILR